mmetsp:Transcript_31391/g.90473  ORF Transcript_31391/g.90473 Transcript_31391/m.90473 type:complete len:219 (+) Transcript_31391:44-700(+)
MAVFNASPASGDLPYNCWRRTVNSHASASPLWSPSSWNMTCASEAAPIALSTSSRQRWHCAMLKQLWASRCRSPQARNASRTSCATFRALSKRLFSQWMSMSSSSFTARSKSSLMSSSIFAASCTQDSASSHRRCRKWICAMLKSWFDSHFRSPNSLQAAMASWAAAAASAKSPFRCIAASKWRWMRLSRTRTRLRLFPESRNSVMPSHATRRPSRQS